jgi:hypothetical protein
MRKPAASFAPGMTRRDLLRSLGFVGAASALAGPAGRWATTARGARDLVSLAAATAPAGSDIGAIDHIVFLMMENRSYDHYFGAYPKGRGFEHQREQHPGRDKAGDGQPAEGGRRGQHERLRGQQEAAPVDQVACRARDDREQQHRQARRGLDKRDVGGRPGQREHQPLRGHGLHPAADVRDELAAPHRREQPVPERRPRRSRRSVLAAGRLRSAQVNLLMKSRAGRATPAHPLSMTSE